MLKLVLVLTLVMVAAGCNTVEGFGKDVSKVGGKIEKTAEEVKNSNGK